MNNITKKQFLSKFGKACFNLALSTSALSATAATQNYYRSRDTQKGNGTYLTDLNLSPFFAVNFDDNQLTLNNGLDFNQGLSQHKPFHAEKGTAVKELLIIDTDVQNKSVFLAQQRPGVEVIEIKKGGLSKLMEVLASYRNLDAVHLVSHAQPGAIQLGGEVVSAETFQESVAAFTNINQAIKPGGDLLFYGCELAKGKQGEDFVTIIKGNTHVDVAASNDLTGNTNYKGDWDLEIQQGSIDTKPINASIAMNDFTGVLQFSGAVDLTTAMGADTSGQGSPYSDADATFDLGGYTLEVDNDVTAAYLYNDGAGVVYLDTEYNSETGITLSFTGGESFTLNSLDVTGYNSVNIQPVTLNFSSDKGDLISQTFTGYTIDTIDFSSFDPSITSVRIEEASGGTFRLVTFGINLTVPSSPLSTSSFDFNRFEVYPNPATDQVSFSKKADRAIIYNMSGQQVGSYDNIKDIDMTALQPGLYYIAIEIEGSNLTRKIIKK